MAREQYFLEVTEQEITHVEKFNLSKVYNFEINKTLGKLEFNGPGGKHRGHNFQKLLDSLK